MKWINSLFPLFMVVLAIIFSFAIPHGQNGFTLGYADSLWLWLIFFVVGIQGLWTWLMHHIAPHKIANIFGCTARGNRREMAWTNVGLGAAGFVALWFGPQYWLAIVIVTTGVLIGALYEHLVASSVNSTKKACKSCCFGMDICIDVALPIALWVLLIIHYAVT